jgi:sugar lactone lactonase YvrE
MTRGIESTSFRNVCRALLWLLLATVTATTSFAAQTRTWELHSFKDFSPGRFQGLALSRDGELTLAPAVTTVFDSEQPVIWSMAQAPDGSIYAATGHRGRVYRIDANGKGTVLWAADEPEVFTLVVDKNGVLYAATSPRGKVYRIERNGKATEYFSPQSTYILSLALDNAGNLYVGTGEEGKIFRVTAPGKAELYYETGQSHVTSLAVDNQNQLLAGTEPNGILYRITQKDKAFVLYDSALPEIRSIVPGPDGVLYVGAMGGGVARRSQAAAAGAAGAAGAGGNVAVTTVTVTAQQGGLDIPASSSAAKQQAPATATPALQWSASQETYGLEKSALYKVLPDNTVETLWSSKDENLYDLLPSAGRILISTDEQGRVYALMPDRRSTLLLQTAEGEATRLLSTDRGYLVATGNMGKVLRMGKDYGVSGTYESPVHDAGTVARWGHLSWVARSCANCQVTYRTRSGNSARPDRTWTDWSAPVSGEKRAAIASPNARFLQWKVDVTGANGNSPVLESVGVSYLPQNAPPVVNSVTAGYQASVKSTAQSAAAQSASTGVYTVTVTDTGDSSSLSTGSSTQKLARTTADEIRISWTAEDPDADRLLYSLYFRGEGEREWKLIKDRLTETSLSLEQDALADGRYLFRVVASDSPDNPPDTARTGELTSAPVVIDHTPPMVTLGPPRRTGSRVEIGVTAQDAASPLVRAEYSLNAGPWVLLQAKDGILDGQSEEFTVVLDNLPTGEHLVVVRVHDSAENAGLAKIVLE